MIDTGHPDNFYVILMQQSFKTEYSVLEIYQHIMIIEGRKFMYH
jgi:hypothetical protein